MFCSVLRFILFIFITLCQYLFKRNGMCKMVVVDTSLFPLSCLKREIRKIDERWSKTLFLHAENQADRYFLTLQVCQYCFIGVRPLSGRWQAPAAVLPEGPKNIGDSHSRARRAQKWPKHASPRARRARGRAKLSLRFGACQCYYMFFPIQPKIAIFTAQFKYLNDG